MAESVDFSGLVRTLVEPLIEDVEQLSIEESVDDQGNALVEIRVADDDAGKVIGRQGRVIKAIRTVVRAAGSRAGQHVDVELVD